ncbi:MAG TPA: hypothetical protein HA276_00030 [Candidatus Poseidoniaceae archaeon]|nr:MAG TPA: hypothetical protein D7I01_00030 [Candidatus Poseidoniales archaeon]HII96055.1 hypothetical protein [Candidatus Poseidoniaceae archaeon]
MRCSATAAPQGFGTSPYDASMWLCEGSSSVVEQVTWSATTAEGLSVPLSQSSIMLTDNGTTSWSINASSWTPSPGRVDVTLSVHDGRGLVVDTRSWQATSRAAGWNLGIETFGIEDGEATVGVRRQGVSILGDTSCILTFSDGSVSKSILLDVTGAFAPSLRVDLTDLGFAEDALITAEVRCDVPFDVDDNMEDDAATAIYRGPSPLDLGPQGWLWALAALLVVGVGGRFLLPSQGPKPERNGQPQPKKSAAPVEGTEPTVPPETAPSEPVVSMIEEPTSEPPVPEDEPIQEEELVEEDGASGRLAMLRRELDGDPDAPQPTLEERMSRFFKD